MIVVHEDGMLIKTIEDEEDEKLKKDVVLNIRGGNRSRMDLANWEEGQNPTEERTATSTCYFFFFVQKKKKKLFFFF